MSRVIKKSILSDRIKPILQSILIHLNKTQSIGIQSIERSNWNDPLIHRCYELSSESLVPPSFDAFKSSMSRNDFLHIYHQRNDDILALSDDDNFNNYSDNLQHNDIFGFMCFQTMKVDHNYFSFTPDKIRISSIGRNKGLHILSYIIATMQYIGNHDNILDEDIEMWVMACFTLFSFVPIHKSVEEWHTLPQFRDGIGSVALIEDVMHFILSEVISEERPFFENEGIVGCLDYADYSEDFINLYPKEYWNKDAVKLFQELVPTWKRSDDLIMLYPMHELNIESMVNYICIKNNIDIDTMHKMKKQN